MKIANESIIYFSHTVRTLSLILILNLRRNRSGPHNAIYALCCVHRLFRLFCKLHLKIKIKKIPWQISFRKDKIVVRWLQTFAATTQGLVSSHRFCASLLGFTVIAGQNNQLRSSAVEFPVEFQSNSMTFKALALLLCLFLMGGRDINFQGFACQGFRINY